jgi:uncharacterized membrane protein (UPF0127 family)
MVTKITSRLTKPILLLVALVALLQLMRGLADFLLPMEQARIDFNNKSFFVEIATTTNQIRRGLQHRSYLGEDRGMLFHFPLSRTIGFWMKDTLIPLDILWLDDELRIIHLEEAAPPCTADPCPSYGPSGKASYVLEINAGAARRAGIGPGDRAVAITRGIEPPDPQE